MAGVGRHADVVRHIAARRRFGVGHRHRELAGALVACVIGHRVGHRSGAHIERAARRVSRGHRGHAAVVRARRLRPRHRSAALAQVGRHADVVRHVAARRGFRVGHRHRELAGAFVAGVVGHRVGHRRGAHIERAARRVRRGHRGHAAVVRARRLRPRHRSAALALIGRHADVVRHIAARRGQVIDHRHRRRARGRVAIGVGHRQRHRVGPHRRAVERRRVHRQAAGRARAVGSVVDRVCIQGHRAVGIQRDRHVLRRGRDVAARRRRRDLARAEVHREPVFHLLGRIQPAEVLARQRAAQLPVGGQLRHQHPAGMLARRLRVAERVARKGVPHPAYRILRHRDARARGAERCRPRVVRTGEHPRVRARRRLPRGRVVADRDEAVVVHRIGRVQHQHRRVVVLALQASGTVLVERRRRLHHERLPVISVDRRQVVPRFGQLDVHLVGRHPRQIARGVHHHRIHHRTHISGRLTKRRHRKRKRRVGTRRRVRAPRHAVLRRGRIRVVLRIPRVVALRVRRLRRKRAAVAVHQRVLQPHVPVVQAVQARRPKVARHHQVHFPGVERTLGTAVHLHRRSRRRQRDEPVAVPQLDRVGRGNALDRVHARAEPVGRPRRHRADVRHGKQTAVQGRTRTRVHRLDDKRLHIPQTAVRGLGVGGAETKRQREQERKGTERKAHGDSRWIR